MAKVENILIILMLISLIVISSCNLQYNEINSNNKTYDEIRCKNFCNDYNLTKRVDYRENFCRFCNSSYNCTSLKC